MDWSGVDYCGLLWCFYQLFRLSFWRHPFTAEHPLLRHWCNDTFLQIWWRNKLISISDGYLNYSFKCGLGPCLPLYHGKQVTLLLLFASCCPYYCILHTFWVKIGQAVLFLQSVLSVFAPSCLYYLTVSHSFDVCETCPCVAPIKQIDSFWLNLSLHVHIFSSCFSVNFGLRKF